MNNPFLQDEKKKKIIILLSIVGFLLIFSSIVYYIWKSQQQYIPPPQEPKVKIETGKDMARESWIAQSSGQLAEQNKKIKELEDSLKQLKQTPQSRDTQTPKEKEEIELGKQKQAVPPPNAQLPPPSPPGSFPPAPGGGQFQGQQQPVQQPKVMKDLIGITEGKGEKDGKDVDKGGQGQQASQQKTTEVAKKDIDISIPAGSFMKVAILTGVDAPAGQKAKGQPYPVLMQVIDKTNLPNRYKSDIEDCFLLGEAYGELSSERAHIRVNQLSCVTSKREIIETQVSGYVVGEDGKTGLGGRVVSKQGQILARTMMAGFLQGVAQAFNQSSTVVNVSPSGTVSTIDPSKSLQAGISGGASKAVEELAKFYMDLAREMFPVIEINAGRKAEVIFLNRVRLGK